MEGPTRNVLESLAARATFWTVMDYGCTMGIRILNSAILTRLLMPEAFGLMALVVTLIVGVSLMSDIGLGPNVIQSRRGDDPVLLNTVWTLQILRGAAIFVISLILAPVMARIYHEPRLMALLPALGLTRCHRLLQQHQSAFDVAALGRTEIVPTRYQRTNSRASRYSLLRTDTSVGLGAGHRIDLHHCVPARP